MISEDQNTSDSALMELMKQGDREAFTQIYNRYWQGLYLHCYKMLGDEQEALDVLQNIFITLWEQSRTIHIHTSLRAYLFRTVRNQTLNAIHKSQSRRQHMESFSRYMEADRPLIDETINFKELSDRIEQEVANLPDKMRVIFRKSQHEDLPQKDIAAELNISEHTVRTVLYRARMILRKRLTSLLLLLIPWIF